MKNKQFKILSLIILCFILLQLNIPPVEASTSYIEMDFDTEVGEGANHIGTNNPSHDMRIWHWSGGYWGNDHFRIEDDEMDMLASGELSHDALDVTYTLKEDLPDRVITFLNNGGSWDDIEIVFSMKRNDVVWYDIFREKPQWRINGNQIETIIKPKFVVDTIDIIYDSPQMALRMPQIYEPYGQQVYSVFTPGGSHLGASWDIEYKDIISHHGELRKDKNYEHKRWNGGSDGTKDGSQMKIGHGTFSGGGAIAYEFWFQIKAEFYIKDTNEAETHFMYSTFNNYTIDRTAEKNKHTFWMLSPYGNNGDEEFVVEIRSYMFAPEGWLDKVTYDIEHIKFDKDTFINFLEFKAEGTPIDATIYRKGIEREDLADRFKEQFFRGYTREYKGETYYYYDFYNSHGDGEKYPTKKGLRNVPSDNLNDYLNQFNMDIDEYQYMIMNP
ncbi:hypothetical protein [Alkaliphilus peptidifermentans]|uniref:Uncharacterized protein n=1 Tax=Alkaliphilus peptidifermentans DSM 18978 TaxID=1120976 RepID=A0A1G5DSU5_9FIRM|nr:hypothetical protein [Alkaliphilus peptidifermentans]SCY17687.1 hypothetical protein SAMN03080606_01001 [Alkaliphilus peptidifermentans DSM 18978]